MHDGLEAWQDKSMEQMGALLQAHHKSLEGMFAGRVVDVAKTNCDSVVQVLEIGVHDGSVTKAVCDTNSHDAFPFPAVSLGQVSKDKSASAPTAAAVEGYALRYGARSDLPLRARQAALTRKVALAQIECQQDSQLGQIAPLRRCLEWWVTLREPERKGCIASIVDSTHFTAVSMAVTMINGIFIYSTTNWKMMHLTEEQSSTEAVAEVFFMLFYAMELCMKLGVHGFFFFLGKNSGWNTFDFALVLASLVEMICVFIVHSMAHSGLIIWRLLHVLKGAKILRVARVVRFLSPLRMMLDCVTGCFSALLWASVLFGFILTLFGIYFVQAATQFLVEERQDTVRLDVEDSSLNALRGEFGSVGQAMLSLFKAIAGGKDWDAYLQMISLTGPLNAIFFVVCMLFFVLLAWNVVTSICVQKAMTLAKPCRFDAAHEKQNLALQDAYELEMLCRRYAEVNSNGTLPKSGLAEFWAKEPVQNFFEMRGVAVSEAEAIANVLCCKGQSNTTDIPISVFVDACMSLNGAEFNADVQSLRSETLKAHWETKRTHSDTIRFGQEMRQTLRLFQVELQALIEFQTSQRDIANTCQESEKGSQAMQQSVCCQVPEEGMDAEEVVEEDAGWI